MKDHKTVTFLGRLAGAIGVRYRITATAMVAHDAGDDETRLALYEGRTSDGTAYDDIGTLKPA